jgi:hypothetical protein
VQDSDFKMRQKGRVDAGKVVKGCETSSCECAAKSVV